MSRGTHNKSTCSFSLTKTGMCTMLIASSGLSENEPVPLLQVLCDVAKFLILLKLHLVASQKELQIIAQPIKHELARADCLMCQSQVRHQMLATSKSAHVGLHIDIAQHYSACCEPEQVIALSASHQLTALCKNEIASPQIDMNPDTCAGDDVM